jgi:hypothetical protein
VKVSKFAKMFTPALALLALPSCGTEETHPPLINTTGPGSSDIPRTCAELRAQDAGLGTSSVLIVGDAAAGCPAAGLVCPLAFPSAGRDASAAGGADGCDAGTSPQVINAVCQEGYWHRRCDELDAGR